MAYQVDNSAYPPDLATAGVNNTAGTTFQYSYNNSASPNTFGVTATTGTTSYYITNTNSVPTAGGYPGHGVGGAAAITNYSFNPSIEVATTSYGVASYGTSGAGTMTRDTTQSFAGSASLKMLWTTSATAANAGLTTPALAVTAGSVYTYSIYLKPSRSVSVNPAIRSYTALYGGGTLTDTAGTPVVIPANTWTRVSNTITIPAGNLSAGFRIGLNTQFASGDTLYADANMATDGSTLYTYADGNSSNWVWSSTADASSSMGPAL